MSAQWRQDPTLGHFLDPSLVLRRGLAQGRQEENLLADLDQDLQLLEEDLTQDQEVALALQIRGIEDKAGQDRDLALVILDQIAVDRQCLRESVMWETGKIHLEGNVLEYLASVFIQLNERSKICLEDTDELQIVALYLIVLLEDQEDFVL